MRLLPGQPTEIAGESITSYSLVNAAINNPDVLPRVWEVFREEDASPLSGLLSLKGLKTVGLREGMVTNKFRTVGSNHIMYPIANAEARKIRIVSNALGKTFISDAYPTRPGYMGTPFYIFLSNNIIRPKMVFELNDNKTQLYAYDEFTEPVEIDGVFRYEVKLWTNSPDEYCDPLLLQEGNEVGEGMTAYEQDFSETGSELHKFHGWGHTYLNLQRVAHSYSGTAKAMANNGRNWYEFKKAGGGTGYTYIDHADMEMLRRAAKFHEYQIIYGKSSVTTDGKVFMKDKRGREVLAGSGILYANDGAIERPMSTQGWTMKYLESIMQEADIRAGKDGKKEIAILGGFKSIFSLSEMLAAKGFITQNNNIVGDGDNKEVNMNYKAITIMDVTVYPIRARYFDNLSRPTKILSNGDSKASWDSIIMPLGTTEFGDNSIELVQLRPPSKGKVSGIDVGGDGMASSVDGTSVHYLWQTGVVCRTDIIKSFMPYSS